ncbi:hypothetical protein HYS96_00180 [Candidatus Daviesbacteria bacterium]|nr:hypothetical protein [Candidatus Daviesbacteria bacterium]
MNTHEVLKEVIAEQTQESFYIHFGITLHQVNQLIIFTQIEKDPINLDGDEGRFMSPEKYEIWRQKGRTIYALTDRVDENGNLCGIFWIGQKELPQRTDYTESLDPRFYQHTYYIFDTCQGKKQKNICREVLFQYQLEMKLLPTEEG